MLLLAELLYGIPEGYVPGPLLFVMYVLPLEDVAHCHGIMFHSCAEDTQLYVVFVQEPASVEKALKTIETCIHDIKMWMLHNWPKMNDAKTKMLALTSPDIVLSDI